MAAPPEKKESTTISMVIDEYTLSDMKHERRQLSSIPAIKGYPFQLRLETSPQGVVYAYLHCFKSGEAALWKCTATITPNWAPLTQKYVFCSWNRLTCRSGHYIGAFILKARPPVQVTISIEEDGNKWRLLPTCDMTDSPPNGILVFGNEKKEMKVNKELLASMSPYFDRLFFGDFKEKNMDKIPIGDVDYEEFETIIKSSYRTADNVLTNKNVLRVLELADRFELKIVEDMVVSYFLNPDTSYTLAQKLLISQERNIPSIKKWCLNECSTANEMKSIKNSPEYADLSDSTKVEILDRVLDLLR